MIVAAVFWQLLQHLGGYYVDHALKRTGPLYGMFALVLGLLAWLYLGAQLTIFAAEVNVVRKRRLWPRSFFSEPLLEADKRALTSAAEVEERVEEQNVEVSFDEAREPRRYLALRTPIAGTPRKPLHTQPSRAILTTLS